MARSFDVAMHAASGPGCEMAEFLLRQIGLASWVCAAEGTRG